MEIDSLEQGFVSVFLSPIDGTETFKGESNQSSVDHKRKNRALLCESLFFEVYEYLLPKSSSVVDEFFLTNYKNAISLWTYRHFPFKINTDYSANETVSFENKEKSGIPLDPTNYIKKIHEFIDLPMFKSFDVDKMIIAVNESIINLWVHHTETVEFYYYNTVISNKMDINVFKTKSNVVKQTHLYVGSHIKTFELKSDFKKVYGIVFDDYIKKYKDYQTLISNFDLKLKDVYVEEKGELFMDILLNILNNQLFIKNQKDLSMIKGHMKKCNGTAFENEPDEFEGIDESGEPVDIEGEGDEEEEEDVEGEEEEEEGEGEEVEGEEVEGEEVEVEDEEVEETQEGMAFNLGEPKSTSKQDTIHIIAKDDIKKFIMDSSDMVLLYTEKGINVAMKLKEVLTSIKEKNKDIFLFLKKYLNKFLCDNYMENTIYSLNWTDTLETLLLFIVFNKLYMLDALYIKKLADISKEHIKNVEDSIEQTEKYINSDKCINGEKSFISAANSKDIYWFTIQNRIYHAKYDKNSTYILTSLKRIESISKKKDQISTIIKTFEKKEESAHSKLYEYLNVPNSRYDKLSYIIANDLLTEKYNDILDSDSPNQINILFQKIGLPLKKSLVKHSELSQHHTNILDFANKLTLDSKMSVQLFIFLIDYIGFCMIDNVKLETISKHYSKIDKMSFEMEFKTHTLKNIDQKELEQFSKTLKELDKKSVPTSSKGEVGSKKKKVVKKVSGHLGECIRGSVDDLNRTKEIEWTIIRSNDFKTLNKTVDGIEKILFKDIEAKDIVSNKDINLKHKRGLKIVNTTETPKKYAFKIDSLYELSIYGECNCANIINQVQLHSISFKKTSVRTLRANLIGDFDFDKLYVLRIDMTDDYTQEQRISISDFPKLQYLILDHYKNGFIDFTNMPKSLTRIKVNVYNDEDMAPLLKAIKHFPAIKIVNHIDKGIKKIKGYDTLGTRSNIFIQGKIK